MDFKRIAISLFMFIVLFLTGDLLYSYGRYALNVEPSTSVSDIFWVAGYFPLLLISYYTIWKNYEHIPIKSLIFTIIGWVLLLVCLVLPVIILSFMTSTNPIETLVLTIYPLLDLLLLLPLIVIIIIYREGYVLRSWLFVTAGVIIYIFGDMSYALFPESDNYYISSFPNTFFIAAYFIIALGAYTMIEMREKFQSIEPSGRYAISQVFVAHKKGTLMAHALTREAKKCVDADVMVGMLTAIQDFVKESFEGEKHHKLDELKYGDVRLIFRRGNDFMLVAVLSGQLTNVIQAALDDTVKKVEETYGTILKDWDGSTRTVDGIKDMVAGLLT